MRLVGELSTEEQARRFSAWLLTRSIDCNVDPAGDVYELWVKDEDSFEEARRELIRFRDNSDSEEYKTALGAAAKIEKQKRAKVKQYQKNVQQGVQKRNVFEAAPLTMALVAISAVVAIFTEFNPLKYEDRAICRALQFVAVDEPSEQLVNDYVNSRDNLSVRLASIYRGELWRTMSPIFIHYGAFHIVFNMFWLVYLGRMIEQRYGTLRMFMIVVFTAIFSNALQMLVPEALGGAAPVYLVDKALLVTRCGGMSGVNYGLFGFVWIRYLYDRSSGFFLPQSTIIIMLVWLVYCMVAPNFNMSLDGSSGSVANWAHGGGLFMGMLLGLSPIGKMIAKGGKRKIDKESG